MNDQSSGPPAHELNYATSAQGHTWAYRRRRGLNWFVLGLLYATYYLCRYNYGTVTPEIAKEFGVDKAALGNISSGRDAGYAFGQFTNGLFADGIGGKQAMAIGAIGTILLNFAFGWWSGAHWSDLGFLITGLVVIRTLDGFAQACGSPGMVKINSAWFNRRERGTFAGIFGGMIQLGQIGVIQLAGILLTGITVAVGGFTLLNIPSLNWRVMFVVPPIACGVVLVLMWLIVKNHPEEAGFQVPHDDGHVGSAPQEKLPLRQVFRTIISHPLIWINGGAYLCTGFVRRSYDLWWVLYFAEVWGATKGTGTYVALGFLLPASAVFGSFAAGFISDKFLRSRRSPVAAVLYGIESIVILASYLILTRTNYGSVGIACALVTLISLTCNSSHSILGTAAVMDIGGRRMSGFALGVVNSCQYIGTIIAGGALGYIIHQHGWNGWFLSMLPFSILGMLLMGGLALATRGRDVKGA